MSKAAARYFVDGLRREMKKFGVKCISMEPNVYKFVEIFPQYKCDRRFSSLESLSTCLSRPHSLTEIKLDNCRTNLTDDNLLVQFMQKSWDSTPDSIKKDYGETYFKKACEYLTAHISAGRTQVSLAWELSEQILAVVSFIRYPNVHSGASSGI